MQKRLPIGLGSFKKLIEGGFYYVDKTLLVKDIIDGSQITVLPRPRRFGKTLNLSMLQAFFEDTANQSLFEDKAIWQLEEYRVYQGAFPVIFISFKDVRAGSWSLTYKRAVDEIAKVYRKHHYLASSEALLPIERELFSAVMNGIADQSQLMASLSDLATYLNKHHGKNVILLIDEYDVPMHDAYLKGYYDEAAPFFATLFASAVKDTDQVIEKGVMTGILMVAKEGIFTGMNNVEVANLINPLIEDKFGFTEEEVTALLSCYEIRDIPIKQWFDGYTFGLNTGIYNPWSVLNCVRNRGKFATYWSNTSDNALVKKMIARASRKTKIAMEALLKSEDVEKPIEESITLTDLEENQDLLWSLLLYTGYLTYSSCVERDEQLYCSLKIPNREILYLFRKMIRKLFKESVVEQQAEELLNALLNNQLDIFQELFQSFIVNSMSYFDADKQEPEKAYHLFVLGILVHLSKDYEVTSNRESGHGRYDIMIVPRKQGPGVIIEFKVAKDDKTLKETADFALAQIREKGYIADLEKKNIRPIILYGIAFKGKQVCVVSDQLR